jgi:hypothetical protein
MCFVTCFFINFHLKQLFIRRKTIAIFNIFIRLHLFLSCCPSFSFVDFLYQCFGFLFLFYWIFNWYLYSPRSYKMNIYNNLFWNDSKTPSIAYKNFSSFAYPNTTIYVILYINLQFICFIVCQIPHFCFVFYSSCSTSMNTLHRRVNSRHPCLVWVLKEMFSSSCPWVWWQVWVCYARLLLCSSTFFIYGAY